MLKLDCPDHLEYAICALAQFHLSLKVDSSCNPQQGLAAHSVLYQDTQFKLMSAKIYRRSSSTRDAVAAVLLIIYHGIALDRTGWTSLLEVTMEWLEGTKLFQPSRNPMQALASATT